MERKLEKCYQIYQRKFNRKKSECLDTRKKHYKTLLKEMKKMVEFGPVNSTSEPVTKEYQMLINYLVYLESFAPLVLTGQVKLVDIDDTFGYRYFIAMNNPIVQKYELLKEADYYCGCIRLYEKWLKYRRKCNKEIPMEWFALSNIGEGVNANEKNPIYEAKGGDELLSAYKRAVGGVKAIEKTGKRGGGEI